jgi:hypothetical protein
LIILRYPYGLRCNSGFNRSESLKKGSTEKFSWRHHFRFLVSLQVDCLLFSWGIRKRLLPIKKTFSRTKRIGVRE